MREKNRNNYLAETPKNKAGARFGNRNARTHGACSVDSRKRRAEVDAVLRTSETLAVLTLAMVDMGRVMQARLPAPPPGAPQP